MINFVLFCFFRYAPDRTPSREQLEHALEDYKLFKGEE